MNHESGENSVEIGNKTVFILMLHRKKMGEIWTLPEFPDAIKAGDMPIAAFYGHRGPR